MPDFFKETAAPSTVVYPDQNQGISTMSEPAYSTKNIDWFGTNNKELDLSVLSQPTYFDPVAENFNKYKQSDYFNQLGFFAGADNEEVYGNTQTFGNKFSNALSGAFDIAKYQFVDQLKGWGRAADALFSWDSTKLYGDPAEQNKEMTDILNKNAIFMNQKDRDSIFNWSKVFNTVQQTGYTFGAMAEIAFEELVTFGLASGLQGMKVANLFKNMGRWGKDAAELSNTIHTGSNLRNAFRAMGKEAGRLPFMGNTAEFASKLVGYGAKNAENTAQVIGRGFGAFYRDFRELNAAMTEARAEAGGTYADLRQQLINQEGNDLTTDKLDKIDKLSREAAGTNFKINTALISISNKIQFDGVFKGIAGAKRIYEDGVIGNLGTKFFERGFNKATLIEGLKKRPIAYLKNNLSEALQENLQESSNVGVKDYYAKIYNGEVPKMADVLSKGIGSQLSKEGFETFLAGFATGAIVGPFTKGITKIYNRVSTTKEERLQNNQKVQNTISQLNELFSGERGPALAKSLLTSKQMQDAALTGDKKLFQDAKDEHIRDTARLLIETGQKNKYFDMLEQSSKELSKTEFEQAFGVDFKADGKNDIQDYISSFKNKVEEMEKDNSAFEYKFGTNPFTPSDIKYKAWTNAKWQVLSTKNAHLRAMERITDLTNSLPKDLQGINAQQILPLFDNTLFKQEKELLQRELEFVIDPVQRVAKQQRLDLLNKIQEKDEKSNNPEESYDKDIYKKYLKQLAKENKIDLSDENIEEALSKIRDVKNLRLDEKALLNNVNWLINPKNVNNLRNAHLDFLNKKLEEFEKKAEEEKAKKELEPTKAEGLTSDVKSKDAVFTPTDSLGNPKGETITTSTESVKDTPPSDDSKIPPPPVRVTPTSKDGQDEVLRNLYTDYLMTFPVKNRINEGIALEAKIKTLFKQSGKTIVEARDVITKSDLLNLRKELGNDPIVTNESKREATLNKLLEHLKNTYLAGEQPKEKEKAMTETFISFEEIIQNNELLDDSVNNAESLTTEQAENNFFNNLGCK